MKDELPIDASFSDEHMLAIKKIYAPWYIDFMNYLACGILPPNMSYHQKRKYFADLKHYIWDKPFLFIKGVDAIYRRCISEEEIEDILHHYHSSSYGGHASTSTSKFLLVAHI